MGIPARRGPRRDDGFYGPGSLTWEVVAHPSMIVSGARNILYTALISEVAQAVSDHSTWFTDILTRAQETAYWVTASVFADTEEARRAGLWVQGKHAKVKGHDPVSHTDYSPSRPDLAIAGHCLIWESNLIAYETYGRTFTSMERERYWREGFASAELLAIDLTTLPPTWQDWRAYYQATIRPRLNLSATAAKLLDYTGSGTFAPLRARPVAVLGVRFVTELTLATLDPLERSILGQSRSEARIAATRVLGRQALAALTLPSARDALERANGPRVHELKCEARAITARGPRTLDHPSTPGVRQAAAA